MQSNTVGVTNMRCRAVLPGLRATTPPSIMRVDAPLQLRADACLSLRFPHVRCTACVTACPASCLKVEDAKISLAGSCLHCGHCTAVCPTGAIEMPGFPPPLFQPDGGGLYVDCWKVPRAETPAGAMRVPCLGGISVNWILEAVSRYPGRLLVFLDRGWCPTCSAGGTGRPPIADSLETANELLRECGLGDEEIGRIEMRPLATAARPDEIPSTIAETAVSRRAFFRNVAQGVASAAQQVVARRVNGEGVLAGRSMGASGPIEPVARRQRLALLDALANRHGRSIRAERFPSAEIHDTCLDHGVCAAVCPTGALARYDDAVTRGLSWDARRCIECGACERHCPSGSIRIGRARPGEALRSVLTRHAMRECRDCGAAFTSSGSERYCAACRKSRDSFSVFFAKGTAGDTPAPETVDRSLV